MLEEEIEAVEKQSKEQRRDTLRLRMFWVLIVGIILLTFYLTYQIILLFA